MMNDVLVYKGYYGDVHFNADDNVFFGKIIGITDLVNFEGSNVNELRHSFEEAVDEYLETCAELGKEPDKVYKGSFNIRISAKLHREASMFAAIKKISLNDFVKVAIDYTLKHKDAIESHMPNDISY